MTGHSLGFHGVMGMLVLLAVAQQQHPEKCEGCDITDEPVNLLQKVLQVDSGRSKKSNHSHLKEKVLEVDSGRSKKSNHSHLKTKENELPTTMYASVVSTPNPSHCSAEIANVGPSAQSAIAAGCDKDIEECNSSSVVCEPNFDRAQVGTFDTPGVVEGKVIVRVAYSSVNPCDYKGVMGMRDADVPYVPGMDFSGVVVAAAPDCKWKPGDVVWGHATGAWAEYNNARCEDVGLMPSNIGFKEAGVMPLVTGTSRAAFEWAQAPWTNSPTVLIIGGTSGTGISAIQMAKVFGAGKIITTCSEHNFDLVKSLGADEAIDYHTQNWWEVVEPGSVDILYDTICLWDTADHAYEILKDEGYFATNIYSAGPDFLTQMKHPKIKVNAGDFDALPSTSTEKLDWLKGLVEAGKFHMPVYESFELDQAPAALEMVYNGHVEGKVAVRVGYGDPRSFAVQYATSSVLLPLMLAILLAQLAPQ